MNRSISRFLSGDGRWFCRRSGSRASIQNPVRPWGASGTQSHDETLCPLGQPEKAIGHEPQIEPWLAPDNRFACRFQNWLASSRSHDENRWERKPQQLCQAVQRTESLGRKARTIPAQPNGLESKKISGRSRGVFLDFPFYRTSEGARLLGKTTF